MKVKKITFTFWSGWVYAVILTCDDQLAIWFKQHTRHYRTPDGRVHSYGGVPGVCCLYPGVPAADYYELLTVWTPGPGEFVWHVLPYKQPYTLVEPPTPPYGCGTETAVASSVNPSTVGQAVTWTATVVDDEGLGTPAGTVEFFDGGTSLGQGTALTGSGDRATSTLTSAALAAGSHTVRAVYTPAAGTGFAASAGQMDQEVNPVQGGGGGGCAPLSSADLFSSASSAVGNTWVPACNYGPDGTYDLSGPHVGEGDRWRLYVVKTTSTGGTVLPPVFTGNNLEATLVASGTIDAVGNLVGVPGSISLPTCEQTCNPQHIDPDTGEFVTEPCDDFALLAVWVCLCTACPGGDFAPIDFGPYGVFQP